MGLVFAVRLKIELFKWERALLSVNGGVEQPSASRLGIYLQGKQGFTVFIFIFCLKNNN